jgi:hypothetical protein
MARAAPLGSAAMLRYCAQDALGELEMLAEMEDRV